MRVACPEAGSLFICAGAFLIALGEYAIAEHFLFEAAVILEQIGDRERLRECYAIQANLWCKRAGLIEEPLQRRSLFLMARERCELIVDELDILDQEPPVLTGSLTTLGSALYGLGEYQEALTHLERAIVILSRNGPLHPLADAINNKAACLDSLGRKDEQLAYLQQVFSLRKENPDKMHLAQAYHNLGYFFYQRVGARTDEFLRTRLGGDQIIADMHEAKSLFEEAYNIYKRLEMLNHPHARATKMWYDKVVKDMNYLPIAHGHATLEQTTQGRQSYHPHRRPKLKNPRRP
jgi:tetratricopeptide (TPR) repeat protein